MTILNKTEEVTAYIGIYTLKQGHIKYRANRIWRSTIDVICGKCQSLIQANTLFTKSKHGKLGKSFPVCTKCQPFTITGIDESTYTSVSLGSYGAIYEKLYHLPDGTYTTVLPEGYTLSQG